MLAIHYMLSPRRSRDGVPLLSPPAGEPKSRGVEHGPNDAIGPFSELEIYAEHRAALDATVFEVGPPLVLELRDGELLLGQGSPRSAARWRSARST